MLGVLIVIAVLGIGLPVALWLVSRRRSSGPAKPERRDEIDQWLVSEFGLGWSDRSRVRRAVLAGQDRAPLRPALREPARGLAARVLADQVRKLRLSRRTGWIQIGTTVAYTGCGIFILATGWDGRSVLGGFIVVNAGFSGASGVYNAVLAPRRIRRNAERVLQAG